MNKMSKQVLLHLGVKVLRDFENDILSLLFHSVTDSLPVKTILENTGRVH